MKDNSGKRNYTTEEVGRGTLTLKKRSLSVLLGSVRTKRIITAVLCFLLAAVVTGTEITSGAYPLGIALTAASSGVTSTFATLGGVVLGSVRIKSVGGIYALSAVALAAARLGLSVWLSSDKVNVTDDKRKRGKFFSRMRKLVGESPTPMAVIRTLTSETMNYSGIMLRENYKIRLALAACAALFAGAWSVVEGGYVYYDLFGAVFSLTLTPIITYLIYAATEGSMRTSPIREAGVYTLLASVTLSLHQMTVGVFPKEIAKQSFDLGVAFACLAACLIAVNYGVHRGTIAGLACGMVLTPAYAPAYAIAAAVCGGISRYSHTLALLLAGTGASAWAVYTGGLSGLTAVFPPVVAAIAIAIPICKTEKIKFPDGVFGSSRLFDSPRGYSAPAAELGEREMRRRISDLSDGLESVSAVLGGMADRLSKPSVADLREIVDSSFETTCADCKNREKCSYCETQKLGAVLKKMTEELSATGVVSAAPIPVSLASTCYNIGNIIDKINLEAGQKIATAREGDKLSVSAADYGLAAELFRRSGKAGREVYAVDTELSSKLERVLSSGGFSARSVTAYGSRIKHIFVNDVDLSATRLGGDDIRKLFENEVGFPLSAPEFELDGSTLSMKMRTVYSYKLRSGTFSVAASSVQRYYGDKRGCGADCSDGTAEKENIPDVDITDREPEGVCGDAVVSFESDGRYYMMISDGMGSGKEAALTSGIVTSLLERLIKSGADLECALKMLNRIVRQSERECSATVDIAEIDLVTGEAKFVKSGAAPSFILRDGSIFRLQSKTVPIGIIRALDAEMIKFDVQEGDTVVMLSDGVARSYDEVPWLLDLMVSDECVLSGDEKCAAMTIVGEAAIRGAVDDITAGIVRIGSEKR